MNVNILTGCGGIWTDWMPRCLLCDFSWRSWYRYAEKNASRTHFNKPPINNQHSISYFTKWTPLENTFEILYSLKRCVLWPSKPHSVTAVCSTCVTMLWQCSVTVPAPPMWCHCHWLGHWFRIWEGLPRSTLYPGSGDFPRSREKHEVSVCCFQGRSCQSTDT